MESLSDHRARSARRVIWSSRIQLAAERDAADLVRTPFPEDEPAMFEMTTRGMMRKMATESSKLVANMTPMRPVTYIVPRACRRSDEGG
ncbi:hypothetical protein WMF28_01750 [Sorangium sp. So ce590]|uniref:hypothetical protein n=1 Tax=Sorangium sp. So ce590 TaxID=3133317 RepID=UPI003F629DDF